MTWGIRPVTSGCQTKTCWPDLNTKKGKEKQNKLNWGKKAVHKYNLLHNCAKTAPVSWSAKLKFRGPCDISVMSPWLCSPPLIPPQECLRVLYMQVVTEWESSAQSSVVIRDCLRSRGGLLLQKPLADHYWIECLFLYFDPHVIISRPQRAEALYPDSDISFGLL